MKRNPQMNSVSPSSPSTEEEDYTYEPSTTSIPHLITRSDLNNLVRNLGLSKMQAEAERMVFTSSETRIYTFVIVTMS